MMIDGWVLDVVVDEDVAEGSVRAFWVRNTDPRDFWEVLERRSVRDEKN